MFFLVFIRRWILERWPLECLKKEGSKRKFLLKLSKFLKLIKVLKVIYSLLEVKIMMFQWFPWNCTNKEIRESLLALARDVTTQVILSMESRVNVMKSTMTSRMGDFVRMILLFFLTLRRERIPTSLLMRCIRYCILWEWLLERKRCWFHTNWKMLLKCGTHNGKAISRFMRVILSGKNLRKLFLESTFPIKVGKLR